MTAVALALAAVGPASANPSVSVTATLAPIGSGGSYVLTVTNTGLPTITTFVVSAGEQPPPTNIVPSPACTYANTPFMGSIKCNVVVLTNQSTQMCYTGHALTPLFAAEAIFVATTATENFALVATAPAVASCPVAGFAGGGGATKCVVPNVKRKKLAPAEKAIIGAHCAVGKIKRVKSSRVKKGSVISQSLGAGRSVSRGAKVNLIVSKGK
jgi:hypothetical protein